MVQDKRGQPNFLKCKKLFYIATIRTSANQGRNLKFVSISEFSWSDSKHKYIFGSKISANRV